MTTLGGGGKLSRVVAQQFNQCGVRGSAAVDERAERRLQGGAWWRGHKGSRRQGGGDGSWRSDSNRLSMPTHMGAGMIL